MSSSDMSEDDIEQMKAKIHADLEAAGRKKDEALSAYLEHLKQPIYRPGKVGREDGTLKSELWEVTRSPDVVSDMPSSCFSSDGGSAVLVMIYESFRVGDEGWGDQKLQCVYFDGQGRLVSVAELDLGFLKVVDQANPWILSLKSLGILRVDTQPPPTKPSGRSRLTPLDRPHSTGAP